jgi:catechol 2,3-dioxygenase-like lactoylglutathione lyase family enzyme
MSEPVAIKGLSETHLAVRDLDRSVAFYRDIVGLQPALHDPDLGAAFFWIGAAGQAMLGLWAAGSAPNTLALVRVAVADAPMTRTTPLALAVIAATSSAAGTVLTKVALRELAPLDLLGIELFASALAAAPGVSAAERLQSRARTPRIARGCAVEDHSARGRRRLSPDLSLGEAVPGQAVVVHSDAVPG